MSEPIDDFLYALEDLDKILEHATGEAEDMTDETVTQIQEEDPREAVADAEIMESAHVQIRVWRSGPRDGDGRHGDIILEDLTAPIEVARWLQSPQCRKNNATRRRVYVWVDDHLVSNADSLPIPDDDDPVRSEVPARTNGGFSNLQAYQERLARAAKLSEEQLEAQLKMFQDQIDRARAFRDKEVTACYEAIEAARRRLAAELAREDAEIESINQRRVVIANQRADMAGDLNTFGQAMEQVKERLADTTPQPGEGLVDRIAGVIQLANQPEIQSGIEGLFGMYLRAKAKTI